jgi:hypothetical protein
VIVQREPNELVLIRQPDHAALAADLIAAWTAEGLPTNPRRARILMAARAHDDGWADEDAAMEVDADGTPVDFIAAGAGVKYRVWPRCLERLADSPYVGALVAQHALTVYRDNREKTEWQPFFEDMSRRRDALLARCEAGAAETIDADYRFVRMADILSLIFCKGWRQPYDHDGYHIATTDGALTVTPNPFGGARVPVKLAARRIARRRYDSATDLRNALAAAPLEWIESVAR